MTTHISTTGLLARGWTRGMIRRLLGQPDLLRDNPHFRAAPQIRLYGVERVEAAEQGEEFKSLAAAAVRRSVAAKAAAQRRRREVLARIAAEPIEVPRLAPRRLEQLAVEHRRRHDEEKRPYERVVRDTTTDRRIPGHLTPDGWKVDYLRHRLTRYEELLDGVHGSSGRSVAEELLRRRIYAAIAEAYPNLGQECERQLSERECGPSPG
ncbi:hypothetical protein ACWDR3_24910 [Streptomyces sp. NPDC001002]